MLNLSYYARALIILKILMSIYFPFSFSCRLKTLALLKILNSALNRPKLESQIGIFVSLGKIHER
jgi:hypothetical protein